MSGTTSETQVDVAIIGGGINGASAAQHAASAGYSVLLAEAGDFADGATARSSRLLHCGLRHLTSGSGFWDMLRRPRRLAHALRTVRADMAARDEVLRSIPHRLKPMTFCLPIYRDDPYPPWQLDLAFAILRLTSPFGETLGYRRYRRSQLASLPLASHLRDHDRLESVAVFREYLFDWPERIALDALADARRMGAETLNYCGVSELFRDGTRWHLTLGDNRKVSAKAVLNLAGAWVDTVSALAGKNGPARCQPISGIHIAVQLPPEFEEHGVFAFNRLGEPLYCLPWRGFHYVGLTRRPYSGDPMGIAATDEEIKWLLSETNHCFPDLDLKLSDILYTWAGVNPLTADPDEPLGSREIRVHDLSEDGLEAMFTLTGGPVMTHRRVAREIVGKLRKRIAPSGAAQQPNFSVPLPDGDEAIRHAISEQPQSLADVIMRRLGLGWDRDQGQSQIEHVARIVAKEMGWDDTRTGREIVDYRSHLNTARRRPNEHTSD